MLTLARLGEVCGSEVGKPGNQSLLWEINCLLCDQGAVNVLASKRGCWSCLQPPGASLARAITEQVLCHEHCVPTTVGWSSISDSLPTCKTPISSLRLSSCTSVEKMASYEPFTDQVLFWSAVTLVKAHSGRAGCLLP